MNSLNCKLVKSRLVLYLIFIIISCIFNNTFAQYGWPTGLHSYEQQNITSTFMEYRPGRYHVGVDMIPNDGHWNAYNVLTGYIDDIEKPTDPSQQHNERILVGGISYIHVDVNDSLVEGMYLDIIDVWLGTLYDPNPLGRHLHFEDGGQFIYGYAYNPFDCNYGLQPYTDYQDPSIYDLTFYPDGSNNPIYGDLSGNIDINVHCNDAFYNNNFGSVYELGYKIEDLSGDQWGDEIWNIQFSYWTGNSGFTYIWESDDHIWATNNLSSQGVGSNGYWNTSLIRNDDYRVYAIARDLSCSQNEIEYSEVITINNDPQEIFDDITQDIT